MKGGPDVWKEAAAVITRLMEHPITIPIHSLSISDGPDRPTSQSLGLKAIRDRIIAHYYETVFDWIKEVETLIHRFEQSGDNGFPQMAIAREIRRIFGRERTKMRTFTVSSWNGTVLSMRERLVRMSSECPPKVKLREVNAGPKPQSVFVSSVVSPHEIQCARNAAEWMNTENDIRGLISAMGPAPTGWRHQAPPPLTAEGFSGAVGYLKETLARRGVPYPE
jgi:hypothetical protein